MNDRVPLRLKMEPLTKSAFAPFGDVIESDGAPPLIINQGTTTLYHALARAVIGDGSAVISIFDTNARTSPIEIRMMERHPLGSQAFYPLEKKRWFVVVSDASIPTPENLRAFIASGEQGVQYKKNVWHHPLLVEQGKQQFLVVDRDGAGDNLEEVFFAEDAFATLET